MLKALFKKELLQLKNMYFYDKKKGKQRSKKGIIGMIILLIFLFCSLEFSFFGFSQVFSVFIVQGYDWLYFAIMGIIALFAGIVGDIFNTYSTVYQSKDNDLLFSLPVKPSFVLISKLLTSLIMGFVFESLVFIPTLITYWLTASTVTLANVLMPISVWFISDALIVSLTCILGWLIALVSSKTKKKNLTKVLSALLFIAIYYFIYFKLAGSLQDLSQANPETLGSVISEKLWPIYQMGLACSGNAEGLLLFVLFVLALSGLTLLILSKTYLKLATTKTSAKKVKYNQNKMIKSSSIQKALIRKEFKRIGQSANYMLNSGIGLIFILGAAVVLFVKRGDISGLLEAVSQIQVELPWVENVLKVAPVIATFLLSPMSVFSCPSISLEGENIWILQTSPIDGKLVLDAKKNTSFILLSVPVALLGIVWCIVLHFTLVYSVLTLISELSFVYFLCQAGLFFDLKRPNLDWTTEVIPIKQGFSVTLIILGGWGLVIGLAALYWLLKSLNPTLYILGLTVIFNVMNIILESYFEKKGSKDFSLL